LRANSDEYIFRSLQFHKNFNKNTLSGINKPLSYTRARELLFKALVLIGCDKSMFGLHSLRSGGSTQAANNNVSDRLSKAHGRWRSENAKDGYVQDSLTSEHKTFLFFTGLNNKDKYTKIYFWDGKLTKNSRVER
jgi:hypothetical protein